MSQRKPEAVFVEWWDSATSPGWDSSEDNKKPLVIRSVGFVVDKNKDVLILTTSRSESGKFLDQLTIPRSVVKKIKKVRL